MVGRLVGWAVGGWVWVGVGWVHGWVHGGRNRIAFYKLSAPCFFAPTPHRLTDEGDQLCLAVPLVRVLCRGQVQGCVQGPGDGADMMGGVSLRNCRHAT